VELVDAATASRLMPMLRADGLAKNRAHVDEGLAAREVSTRWRDTSTLPSMDVLDVALLPPDPVVEAYKKDVDRTLFDRNLALSPSDRIEQLQRFVAFLHDMQEAGRRAGGRVADAEAD
jgi:hypothetical protein